VSGWFVYVVRCADGTLYTGIALDPERRVAEHNGDNRLGARYTRGRRPVRLVYTERRPSRSAAARRESEIKRLARPEKERLIAAGRARRRGRVYT
jgi:putative endonuclease